MYIYIYLTNYAVQQWISMNFNGFQMQALPSYEEQQELDGAISSKGSPNALPSQWTQDTLW